MSFLASLLKMLPDAAAQGLIWGILAMGVYITYKILDIADLTVDGSICTGGCVCALLISLGVPVWVSVLAALLAGMLTGVLTGLLHTALGIPSILAGILTQLILYSVNLSILGGKSMVAINPRIIFLDEPTGSLDRERGRQVMEILKDVNEKRGVALVMVTHSLSHAEYASRRIEIEDGMVK